MKKRRPELFGKSAVTSWNDAVEIQKEVDIDVSSLCVMLREDPHVLVIDTRNPLAFRAAHIPHAMNIPYEYIDNMFMQKTNPFCINKKMVFACPIGEKSKHIASYLREKKVEAYSLIHGVTAWRDAGYALDSDL